MWRKIKLKITLYKSLLNRGGHLKQDWLDINYNGTFFSVISIFFYKKVWGLVPNIYIYITYIISKPDHVKVPYDIFFTYRYKCRYFSLLFKKNVTKRAEDWFQITYIISKPDHVTCKYLSDYFVYLYRYVYIDYY